MTLTDVDRTLIVAYWEQDLSPAEMIDFEIRLSQEEELAEELEAYGQMDDLSHALYHGRRGGLLVLLRSRSLAVSMTMLAAAAILLLLFKWPTPSPPAPVLEWKVVAVPTWEEVVDASIELRLLEGSALLVPPAGELRNGDPGPDPGTTIELVTWETFRELITEKHESRAFAALDSPPTSTRSRYFVIPVRASAPCSAVVLLLFDDGETLGSAGDLGGIAYPPGDTWTESSGRLAHAGEHLLPGDIVVPEAALDPWRPGFPIPRESMTALVGLREDVLDERLRRDLADRIEEVTGVGSLELLRAYLEEQSFEVRTLFVEREP